jgi:hypothetical protein
MHFNILLTLSTLTALSSNAAAQLPLSGLNGLSGLGNQVVPSSQTPGPSSTPIPTLTKRQAKPTAFPFKASTLSAPALNARDSSDTESGHKLGGLLGGGGLLVRRSTPDEELESSGMGGLQGEDGKGEDGDVLGGLLVRNARS